MLPSGFGSLSVWVSCSLIVVAYLGSRLKTSIANVSMGICEFNEEFVNMRLYGMKNWTV